MEIENIQDIVISPSLQEWIQGRVKRSGQTDEQAGQTQAAKRPAKADSAEDTREIQRDSDKEIKPPKKGNLKDLTDESIKNLAARMNQIAKDMRFSIQFVVDQHAGKVTIKVLDSEGKLIRQIPPEVMAGVSSEVGADLGVLLNTIL